MNTQYPIMQKFVVLYQPNPEDTTVYGLFNSITEAEAWIKARNTPIHYSVEPLMKVKAI